MRMFQVGTVQRVRICKHRSSLAKRDAVLLRVGRSLSSIPFEHNSVYTEVA